MKTKEVIKKLKQLDPEGDKEFVVWMEAGVFRLTDLEDQIATSDFDGKEVVAIFPD